MKIQLKIWNGMGITCLSENCVFKRECANHTTAGEFRSEDGFTPELYEKHGEYFCDTYDRPSYEELDLNFNFTSFPENYNDLGRGALTKKELDTKACINYQI